MAIVSPLKSLLTWLKAIFFEFLWPLINIIYIVLNNSIIEEEQKLGAREKAPQKNQDQDQDQNPGAREKAPRSVKQKNQSQSQSQSHIRITEFCDLWL